MHALHVIAQVPVPWESITRNASLAAFKCTEEWFLAVAVHCMGFALMTEQAGCRRESSILTGVDFATIGFQVGIYELTVSRVSDGSSQ